MDKIIHEYKKKYPLLDVNMTSELVHGIYVSNLAHRVAEEMGCEDSFCHLVAMAGVIHDIGKLELAETLGNNPDTLTVEEMKYVRMHTIIGAQILEEEDYPKEIVDMVLYHHENCDGSGYPYNRCREDIPLGARILRVCDVFAALTSDRPYRKAFDLDAALDLMIEEARMFDLQVFLAFMNVIHSEDFVRILVRELPEDVLQFLARIPVQEQKMRLTGGIKQ